MAFGKFSQEEEFKIDYSRCQPITVMANYNRDGKIMPVYVSLVDSCGNVCNTKIDGIKYTKDSNKRCISFCCIYTSGSRQRECVLTFYIMEHVWVLEN